MHVTMVKKRLLDGNLCPKCAQVDELLRSRGYLHKVDEVVWALEGDDSSAGMILASAHGVDLAPFFIVNADNREHVYTSALKLIRDVFADDNVAESPIDMTELSTLAPQDTVERVLGSMGKTCGIAFSGAEDVVLIDMAEKSGHPYSVFTLDTGRLHPQTYQFIEKVRDRYHIEISMMTPASSELEPFVNEKGLFSFYEDGHSECCGIRKVEPLKRALATYAAWMTGQRRDQSPATRDNVVVAHEDPTFLGVGDGPLLKFNPIANWRLTDVWDYIRQNDVPYNELHDEGFVSIGCEPCTRAKRPGEHERAARWWWEDGTKRECGLHSGGR